MATLWPITIFSCLMALLSHKFSEYDLRRETYSRREWVFYTIMAVAMILFCGLRKGYNDTYAYRHAYELIVDGMQTWKNWDIGNNPGFVIANILLAKAGASTQTFLMVFAVVTVGVYLWFIHKYTCNLWLSVFLMFTMGVYTFTFAAIKQCTAVAFCLIATDCAIRKKWIPFLLWILLASTFHPYALMYLIVPLLMFRPWSRNTFWMLLAFGLIGVLLQPLMGTVVNITSMLGEEYDAASFSGEGVNPFRLAVCSVPLIVSFITRRQIEAADDKVNNLIVNLSMLNGEIMFVALFGTANYFARLANYFLIFQTISLPWLFTHFNEKSKQQITLAATTSYTVYYYYSNAINQHFDLIFSQISLWEYLKSLFCVMYI